MSARKFRKLFNEADSLLARQWLFGSSGNSLRLTTPFSQYRVQKSTPLKSILNQPVPVNVQFL